MRNIRSVRWCLNAIFSMVALSQLQVCMAADNNILLVIADDMGSDVAPGYSEGTNKPPMPVLQGLQANGVTFRNVWANPVCSPTRATILTGRYGFRTGVQNVSMPANTIGVSISEPSIPRALQTQVNIASTAFGKWHVARQDAAAPDSPPDHPILMGFSRYIGNLMGQVPNYSNWSRYVNNTTLVERLTTSTTYATTDVVNQAVSWINRQGNQNWFCWVALNAPHSPFHKPSNELHSYDALAATGAPDRSYYEAMCESLDTEMGRLLSSIPTDVKNKTMIIFIGDNGTPSAVKSGGFRGSKGNVYDGGLRVPLVVSGALVANPNRNVDQLVNSTDIFATVMDVHGINLATVNEGRIQDTVSFLPYVKNVVHTAPRTTSFGEIRANATNFSRAVRNDRYKLVRLTNNAGVTSEEFYDLQVDAQEASNILLRTLTPSEQTNLDSLRARLLALSN
ncbi:MAG: sulfatase-like hydrolase/transferase [Pirellulaceae bacterium]|nr:sulfatase-like hydrolase/transferase [Pirellulaceae bacterium]